MTLQMARPAEVEPVRGRRIERGIVAVVLAGVGVFGVGTVYHHQHGAAHPLIVHGVEAR
jgi:hypothetical protein